MKFIRKNGRIIPIRERIAQGVERHTVTPAIVTGAVIGGLEKTHLLQKMHVASFWGLKGAIAGAAIGGLAATAKNKGIKTSDETQKKMAYASGTSFVVSATSRALATAQPFLGRNKKVKTAVKLGKYLTTLTTPIVPIAYAASAKKGERGRVLAAGSIGAVGGINMGRIGKKVLRNRSRLGLGRI